MKTIIGLLLITSLTHAKTVELEGKQYSCNPVETCEDKVKKLQAEIAKLKKQIKEAKPNEIVKEVIVEKQVEVVKTEVVRSRDENIISLGLTSGQNGLSTNTEPSYSRVKSDRKLGVGLMYQRLISDDIYVGGSVDTNESVGLNVGLGF